MDLETAAVSREAQTVGAAAVIQEDDPPPPSRLTWLAQHLRISPEEGAPECHLLSRTTTGRGGGGGDARWHAVQVYCRADVPTNDSVVVVCF